MNQNFVKVIGMKDKLRKGTDLLHVNQVEGLKDILNRVLLSGQILIVGRVFQCSNGSFPKL